MSDYNKTSEVVKKEVELEEAKGDSNLFSKVKGFLADNLVKKSDNDKEDAKIEETIVVEAEATDKVVAIESKEDTKVEVKELTVGESMEENVSEAKEETVSEVKENTVGEVVMESVAEVKVEVTATESVEATSEKDTTVSEAQEGEVESTEELKDVVTYEVATDKVVAIESKEDTKVEVKELTVGEAMEENVSVEATVEVTSTECVKTPAEDSKEEDKENTPTEECVEENSLAKSVDTLIEAFKEEVMVRELAQVSQTECAELPAEECTQTSVETIIEECKVAASPTEFVESPEETHVVESGTMITDQLRSIVGLFAAGSDEQEAEEVAVLEEVTITEQSPESCDNELKVEIEDLAVSIDQVLDNALENMARDKYCSQYNITAEVFDRVQSFYQDHMEDELIANGFLRKIMAECIQERSMVIASETDIANALVAVDSDKDDKINLDEFLHLLVLFFSSKNNLEKRIEMVLQNKSAGHATSGQLNEDEMEKFQKFLVDFYSQKCEAEKEASFFSKLIVKIVGGKKEKDSDEDAAMDYMKFSCEAAEQLEGNLFVKFAEEVSVENDSEAVAVELKPVQINEEA